MIESKDRPQATAPESPEMDSNPSVETLTLDSLMGKQRMVRISHDGEIYTLRVTRNNRLILTK